MRQPSRGVEGLTPGRGTPSKGAYQLLCECSYKVRCEVVHYGERLGELAFFDNEEASTTWGEQVVYCPGCRSRLGLQALRP